MIFRFLFHFICCSNSVECITEREFTRRFEKNDNNNNWLAYDLTQELELL